MLSSSQESERGGGRRVATERHRRERREVSPPGARRDRRRRANSLAAPARAAPRVTPVVKRREGVALQNMASGWGADSFGLNVLSALKSKQQKGFFRYVGGTPTAAAH